MKLKEASKKEMQFLYTILNRIISLHEKQKKPVKIKIKGKNLWICPNVFNPDYARASTMLTEHLKAKTIKNRSVLDIGTGSGVYAIFSAYAGASKVLATDISPYAVKCAQKNVKLHHMEDKIEVRKGDLFKPVKKEEKFDIILANLPFFKEDNFKFKRSYIDKFFIDEKGRIIKTFIKGAKKHLNKNGNILMLYGTSGFVNDLLKVIKKYHYQYKILDTKNYYPDPDIFYLLELKCSS